jgi:membrane associated rhomboid family serine protease
MIRPDPTDMAVARCIFAFVTIMIALTISHVALEFGFSNQSVRNVALIGALIAGVILAVEYFGYKLRKPK